MSVTKFCESSMALRQRLQLKQQQKLSPLQIQVIKLTELPVLELEERIKQELEDNPALEEGLEELDEDIPFDDNAEEIISQEEIVLGDYLRDEEVPDYQMGSSQKSEIQQRDNIPFQSASSLHEFLLNQLHLWDLAEEETKIAEYIIGNIDENGYLERSLTSITDDLLFQQNIEVDENEIEQVLHIIQQFDPLGVGARNLQECLEIQLKKKTPTESTVLSLKILDDYFNEFSKRHYEKIKKGLNINDDILRDIIDEIISLNPKPGNNWGDSLSLTLNTIIHDFIVEAIDGELTLSLNNKNVPELRVSREYSNLLQGYSGNKKSMSSDDKNAVLFVKQKLDSARWFIDAIKQRQSTLMHTIEAIVNYQQAYFLSGGDEALLNPMILKDIADVTGLDISTVSRVANSKYVQTPFGIFPLKFFFSEGLQTDSGEEVSTREIKKILQECVEGESKRKPLTDDELAAILQEKGYQIARRTVAKYREQLNIPVARLRKEL